MSQSRGPARRRWSLLIVRLRSRYDYAAYLLRKRRRFALPLILFVGGIGMFAAQPVADSVVLTVGGFLLAVGSVVDFGRCYREVRSYVLQPMEVAYESLRPDPSMELVALERQSRANDYAFAARPHFLRSSGLLPGTAAPLTAYWDSRPFKLPPEMETVAAGVLYSHYRESRAPHFNGCVVRQVTDLDDTGRVGVGMARYFDLLSTNYLAAQSVSDAEGNCVVEEFALLSDGFGALLKSRGSLDDATLLVASRIGAPE